VIVSDLGVDLASEASAPTGRGVTIQAMMDTHGLPETVSNPDSDLQTMGVGFGFQMVSAEPSAGGGMHYAFQNTDPYSDDLGGEEFGASGSVTRRVGGPITEFTMDVGATGSVSFVAKGTSAESLIAGDSTPEWTITGEGSITYSCQHVDVPEGGIGGPVALDPEMALNPLCRQYASLFGQPL